MLGAQHPMRIPCGKGIGKDFGDEIIVLCRISLLIEFLHVARLPKQQIGFSWRRCQPLAQEHLRQTVCLDLEFMPLDILDALPQFCIRVVMPTIGIQILFALDGIGSTKYEESGIAQFICTGMGMPTRAF